MIIDQILPHGYAFAQVSVMGTGRSNHCMDLMGNAEQLGVDAAGMARNSGLVEWPCCHDRKSYDAQLPGKQQRSVMNTLRQLFQSQGSLV